MNKTAAYYPYLLGLILITTVSFQACRQKYTPKPKGYFRIDFPEKEYKQLENNYPYSFEYSNIANVEPDRNNNKEKYWINIQYPDYRGTIHISYKNVTNNIGDYLEDSYKMVYKHAIKADAISEKQFLNPEKKVYGILYKIKGNTASSVQFIATDSISRFLRGALYFYERPNQDSLRPVIEYVEQDIYHLIETLIWK